MVSRKMQEVSTEKLSLILVFNAKIPFFLLFLPTSVLLWGYWHHCCLNTHIPHFLLNLDVFLEKSKGITEPHNTSRLEMDRGGENEARGGVDRMWAMRDWGLWEGTNVAEMEEGLWTLFSVCGNISIEISAWIWICWHKIHCPNVGGWKQFTCYIPSAIRNTTPWAGAVVVYLSVSYLVCNLLDWRHNVLSILSVIKIKHIKHTHTHTHTIPGQKFP